MCWLALRRAVDSPTMNRRSGNSNIRRGQRPQRHRSGSGGGGAGARSSGRSHAARDSEVRGSHDNRAPRASGAPKRNFAGREDIVIGRNSLSELIKRYPDRIHEVWVVGANSNTEGSARGGAGRSEELRDLLAALDVPVIAISRDELTELVGSESHQGVAARIAPRKAWGLEELFQEVASGREDISETSLLLALDNIVDPQNFGAMLRAAECFGVDGVVWSKNRGAPVSAVVSKVSVGGAELVRLAPVSNLQRALEVCKKAGYWIVGASLGEGSQSLDAFEFPEKTVIVMGAEGEGLSHLIEQNLDFRVTIPMLGAIDSLNVSQATAVLLAAASRSHRLRAFKGAPRQNMDIGAHLK